MDVTLPNGKVISGVPEGTPKDVIMDKAISSGIATIEDFNLNKPKESVVSDAGLAPRMKRSPVDRVDLASEATETLGIPELQNSGILYGEEGGAALTPALLTATDPNEIAQIISSNYPNIATQYQKAPDGSVYPVLTNRETNAKTVINRPGISGFDVMQTLGMIGAYSPAGRATSVTGAALKSGSTGAALEGVQSVSGGDFDPMTPILDAALGGFGQKAVELIKKARSSTGRGKPVAERKLKEFVSNNFTSGKYKGKQKEDAVQEIIKAAKSNDQQKLASIIDADPEFLSAQERLGMKEAGLSSYASKNQTFQETEQALKKIPGSKLSADEGAYLTELQQKADDLIEGFGGTTEKATLSRELVESATKTIDDLSIRADDAYTSLAESINPKTKVDTSKLQGLLNSELSDVGGRVSELTSLEKTIYGLVNKQENKKVFSSNALMKDVTDSNVTYRAIDRRRKQIGEALSGKGGPFKDSGKAELSKWYSLLTEAQEGAAPQFSEQWKAAKQLVSQRKELEENAITSFGKNLSDAFMPKMGQAVKSLSKGDYKKFDELLSTLPESERKRVVTSALNDVFTQGSRKEQQLSVAGFSDWFNAINREPELKRRIYKNIPAKARKVLNDLGRVTNGVRNAQSKQPVGGQLMASDAVMDKVVDGIGKNILSKMPGLVGAAADIFIEKSSSKGTDAAINLLGDPVFVKNIRLLASEQAKKAEQRIMKTKAFKEWSATLGEEELKTINTVGLKQYLTEE